jgi:capsid protein
MKPEQPTNNFPDFMRSIIVQIGRAFRLPANVSLGDSSGYNYASGRLDKQEYHKSIINIQNQMGIQILDRIFFDFWLTEAALIPGMMGLNTGAAKMIRQMSALEWYWDGFEHVDPVKEANAQNIRLANKTTTYKDEYAKAGKDWREQFKQAANEKQLMEELGLTADDLTVEEEPEENEEEESKA